MVTDAGDAIDNDIRAWCHATGHQLASAAPGGPAVRVLARGFMTQADIAFPNVTVAEYLTFAEAMASADIHLFVQ